MDRVAKVDKDYRGVEKFSELENRLKTLSRMQLSREKEAKFGRGDGNRQAKLIGCNMS